MEPTPWRTIEPLCGGTKPWRPSRKTLMLAYHLNSQTGIVEVRPRGPLEAHDFTSLSLTMNTYIADHGRLRGLLLELDHLPGFDDWDAIAAQLRFVRQHLPKVDRVALLTDNPWLEPLPDVVRLLTPVQVRRFALERRGDAYAWIVASRAH